MLAAHSLAFGFASRRIGEGISLDLGRGETLAVLGGNGVGKTTLLRTLLGLLRPLEGRVVVDGRAVDRLGVAERARHLAYVPQQHVPPFAFTVSEAVMMGRAARLGTFARPGVADHRAVDAALERLGIGALAHRAITEISGGERQLALIARALAQDAQTLILDEPTASLDFGNCARVLTEIDRLRGTGLSIVFSTHEPQQALVHADRALLLEPGGALAFDTAERALTAANVSRLYGICVELVEVRGRPVFVTADGPDPHAPLR